LGIGENRDDVLKTHDIGNFVRKGILIVEYLRALDSAVGFTKAVVLSCERKRLE
jgi:hypothetical protein